MRTNNWAFQISRSIYDSDIWMKPSEWLKVWIYLLWRVNFEDNNLFKRWENLFNYQVIAIECGVTYNVVNKCINFLKSAKQVSTRKTTRGVVLAINNYETYQDLSSYRQNRSKTEAKQKQNKSYTITEQWNNETIKEIDKKSFLESSILIYKNQNIWFYLFLEYIYNSDLRYTENFDNALSEKIRNDLNAFKTKLDWSTEKMLFEWKNMIDWYAKKNKTVKDLASTTRNWFNKKIT